MNKVLTKLGLISLAVIALLLFVSKSLPLNSLRYTSFPARAFADGNVQWTGQGTSNGSLDDVDCSQGSYLLWVFTVGGGTNTVTSATLMLGGSGSGSYSMTQNGNEWKATTGYFDLSTLTASVSYVGSLGNGNSNLVISHGCPNGTTPTPTPSGSSTPTPTPTPTPASTPTPTPTPGATNPPSNPGGPGDGRSDGLSSCPSCTQAPQGPTQAVLGASTGPAVLGLSTTSGEEGAMPLIQIFGAFLSAGLGLRFFKKNA